MEELFNINPKISTTMCTIIGLILTDDLSAIEHSVLGNWLMLISQILITNANSQAYIQNKINQSTININSKKVKKNYNPFIYDIDMLKRIFKNNKSEDLSNLIEKINKRLDIIERVLNNIKQ